MPLALHINSLLRKYDSILIEVTVVDYPVPESNVVFRQLHIPSEAKAEVTLAAIRAEVAARCRSTVFSTVEPASIPIDPIRRISAFSCTTVCRCIIIFIVPPELFLNHAYSPSFDSSSPKEYLVVVPARL